MRRAGGARIGHATRIVGIALLFALGVPAAAWAGTIDVDETAESATFFKSGTDRPADYSDFIRDTSNDNGECSLREAIAASNRDEQVDGCAAGDGPGDVIELPAGRYDLYDGLIVLDPVIIRGANAGRRGSAPDRGAESVITLVNNPNSVGQPALFWLGAPSPGGPSPSGGSVFDGLTLAGNSNPLCVQAGSLGTCEEWAIVQPEKSGGGPDTAPGLKLRNSIVRDFTSGVYIGGEGAVIARNRFVDNDALIGAEGGVNSGVDLYSDATYTNLNPVVVANVFANPAVAGLEYQGYNSSEVVAAGVIRRNLFDVPSNGAWAMLLLNTNGQQIRGNVIRDASPPPVESRTLPYGLFLDGVSDAEVSGNTITGLGTALRVRELGVPWPLPGIRDLRVNNNRIYDNRYAIRVVLPYPALSIDARANWWGANGGAGSNGARPGAPNPVNGVRFEDANGSAAPDPGGINTADPLKLTCSMPSSVTVNTPVSLTGRVAGMPAVDRTAASPPWFEAIHVPLIDASVSGVSGSTFGFGRPPSTGIRAGNVVPGGGSLTGTLVAKATGTGAGQVALDSEQVACPFKASPEDVVVDKTPQAQQASRGGLITYRITVRNRGRAPVRRLRVCDRPGSGLTFVRSKARLRRGAKRRRCLVIGVLRPGQRKAFNVTFRVGATATPASVTNVATIDTKNSNASPAGSSERRRREHARDTSRVGVRGVSVTPCVSRARPEAHVAC